MSTLSSAERFEEAERQPSGLFLLFFSEMWERFSFYGMRALLVFYMIKGFMKTGDSKAYAIYGAYGALVYATPYLGGMLADKYLGQRLAVIVGGLLMASGHLVLTIESETAFYCALALLICGNGFFKPNISTMVGALYPPASGKRDSGFTIFYMGINLGAALAPIVCGYIGETYGYHWGFGLATVGMLTGVATFVAPRGIARGLILTTSVGLVLLMFVAGRDNWLQLAISLPIALVLLTACLVSCIQLGRGGLPDAVGRPNNPTLLGKMRIPLLVGESQQAGRMVVGLSMFGTIIVGTLIAVPIFAGLVKYHLVATWVLNVVGILAFGSIILTAMRSERVERQRLLVVVVLCFFSMLFWAFFEQGGSSVNNFTDRNVDRVVGDKPVVPGTTYERVAITQEFLGVKVGDKVWTLNDINEAEVARRTATDRTDAATAAMQSAEADAKAAAASTRAELEAATADKLGPAEIDRAVMAASDKAMHASLLRSSQTAAMDARRAEAADRGTKAGQTVYENALKVGFTESEAQNWRTQMTEKARVEYLTTTPVPEVKVTKSPDGTWVTPAIAAAAETNQSDGYITFKATQEQADKGMGIGGEEIKASVFQAANPMFILIFGVPISLLWAFLGARGKDPSAPVKFAFGLIQLAMGFGAFWYGAVVADSNGMVAMGWLLLGYLLQTTGELCLSPIGLSLVTKLSPARMVSTIMGAWFLATAFSHLVAAAIANLTAVAGDDPGSKLPTETLPAYGEVFGGVGVAALAAGLLLLAISPILKRMMHMDLLGKETPTAAH